MRQRGGADGEGSFVKRLLIVGAGGFGREMFAAARESLGFGVDYETGGFLDDNLAALDGFEGYPPVVGRPSDYAPCERDVFITALGTIEFRRRCADMLESRGARFVAVIHRSAVVGPNVTVGEGSFVAPNVSLTADVSVGRHSCIFHNTSIGHDSRVGDFAHVYAQCAIGGGVTIGDGASVYPGSVVVPRRTIGARAVVGAGSAVFTDVPDGARVIGNPAAPLV